MAKRWRSSIYGGFALIPLRALCLVVFLLHHGSVGEGGAVQVAALPRTGRVMCLEAGRAPRCFTPSQLVALHHPCRDGQVP